MSNVKSTTRPAVQMHEDLKGVKYGTSADKAAVDKAIESAVKAVQKGRVEVQKAAVLILLHAYHHGDYRPASALVKALGNSVNQKALVDWFCTWGGLEVNAETEEFGGWNGKEFIKEYFEDAKATPWWTHKPQKAWAGFELDKELQKLLKRAAEAAVKAEGAPKDVPFDLQVSGATRQQLMAILNPAPALALPDTAPKDGEAQ